MNKSFLDRIDERIKELEKGFHIPFEHKLLCDWKSVFLLYLKKLEESIIEKHYCNGKNCYCKKVLDEVKFFLGW